jgi:hypothetical protein
MGASPVVERFCGRKFFFGDFAVAVCIEVCKGGLRVVSALLGNDTQRGEAEPDHGEYGDDSGVHGISLDWMILVFIRMAWRFPSRSNHDLPE